MHEIPLAHSNGDAPAFSPEAAVHARYTQAAREPQPSLCCAVAYDPRWLEALPAEIVERDYGCGDPSRWLRRGETVLDLGCGAGKACYIAAQIVGPSGRVIGVDANDDMLAIARKYRAEVGKRLGYHNVEFRKARIQDLALDLEQLDAYLAAHPIRSSSDWLALEAEAERLRAARPMIADGSIDVVVSNCVLNLVRPDDRHRLFAEIFRVLRTPRYDVEVSEQEHCGRSGPPPAPPLQGGEQTHADGEPLVAGSRSPSPAGFACARAVISDIVCDEDVPEHLRRDPQLWSGCISGAFREDRFLEAFEEAGFHGVEIVARQADPWAVVEGIEFRSITVQAWKGKQGPCLERRQAVVYKGPWKSVTDDDGHTLHRGRRTAVCDKTYRLLTSAPYDGSIEPVPPRETVPLEGAAVFDCRRGAVRSPRETKGAGYDETRMPDSNCCGPQPCC